MINPKSRVLKVFTGESEAEAEDFYERSSFLPKGQKPRKVPEFKCLIEEKLDGRYRVLIDKKCPYKPFPDSVEFYCENLEVLRLIKDVAAWF